MPLLDPLSSVVTALKKADIIPDVLPASLQTEFIPTTLFSIVYPTGKETLLGTELTREDALDEPDINFTPMLIPDKQAAKDLGLSSDEEPTYTLVMTDPDAPSRADPKYREFRHWVITGLKAPADSTSETQNLYAIKSKPSTTPYRPPGPPPGSGFHRYTFLLFLEPSPSFSIPSGAKEYGAALEERRSWSAWKFGQEYGLKLVGTSYFLVRGKDE